MRVLLGRLWGAEAPDGCQPTVSGRRAPWVGISCA